MKLIATPKKGSSYRYGLRTVKAGEEFETQAVYGKIWIGLGLAKASDGSVPAKASVVRSKPDPEAPKPETIFDAPGSETDEERHRRLFPDRVYEGVVSTPESEASGVPPVIAEPSQASIFQMPDLEPEEEDSSHLSDIEADTDDEDDADDIAALRARYEELYGKKPYMGWKEDQLREKIADAEKNDF